MVTYKNPILDSAFSALADSTRRAIVIRLIQNGPTSVNDLCEPFNISRPAVSKHLRVLRAAGIVEQEKVGRKRRCKLKPEALIKAQEWLHDQMKFWQGNLEQLENFLEKENKQHKEEQQK